MATEAQPEANRHTLFSKTKGFNIMNCLGVGVQGGGVFSYLKPRGLHFLCENSFCDVWKQAITNVDIEMVPFLGSFRDSCSTESTPIFCNQSSIFSRLGKLNALPYIIPECCYFFKTFAPCSQNQAQVRKCSRVEDEFESVLHMFTEVPFSLRKLKFNVRKLNVWGSWIYIC